MTGDSADIIARLAAVLPRRWFAEQQPVLGALLYSIAAPWVWLYSLIAYVVKQTRLMTAVDDWLDIIAADFFGDQLIRKPNEADGAYRVRVRAALLRDAATRSAIAAGLTELIGAQPIIFEPANCADTGCYGTLSAAASTGMGYGSAGGWGSLGLPYQFFITATRPAMPGIGMLAGYGTSNGGYGEGTMSYVDLSLLPGHVTDADIQARLCSLLPVNAVAWLRIL